MKKQKSKTIDSKLDKLHDSIDSFFKRGSFSTVDIIIEYLAMRETDTDLLLGYLTVTLPAKSSLNNRAKLYERCKSMMNQELLKGLE